MGREVSERKGKKGMKRNMKEGFEGHPEHTEADINKLLQADIPGFCGEAGTLLVKSLKQRKHRSV